MRIENDLKLDFKDVLFRPKRSKLKSRSEVNLERTFTFVNSKQTWTGVPILAANMDTVGTFEMAAAFAELKLLVCIHKHYTIDEWVEWTKNNPSLLEYVALSSGTSDLDFEKANSILESCNGIKFVCLDVANGYSEHFVSHVRRVREKHPNITIIAGNVVTGEMVEELVLSGADIVKVGIGPGKFQLNNKFNTIYHFKNLFLTLI